jgi:hypothetical protein
MTDEEWQRTGHGAIRNHYPRMGPAIAGFLGGGTETVCDACGVRMVLRNGKWLAEAAESRSSVTERSNLRPNERYAADNLLNRPHADPDDDANIVARAALRLAASPAGPEAVPQSEPLYLAGYNDALDDVAGGGLGYNDSGAVPQSEPPEVYVDRNLVVQAFAQAMERDGYPVWWGVDESEPDWPVLYIDTDEGQVSWHIPASERIYEPPIRPEHQPKEWDGHTTPEKFDRLRARLASPAHPDEEPR